MAKSASMPSRSETLPVPACYNWYSKGLFMAISKELLDILVCPLCQAKLDVMPGETGLKCVQCKRVYPVRDSIPVMMVDEARIEE